MGSFFLSPKLVQLLKAAKVTRSLQTKTIRRTKNCRLHYRRVDLVWNTVLSSCDENINLYLPWRQTKELEKQNVGDSYYFRIIVRSGLKCISEIHSTGSSELLGMANVIHARTFPIFRKLMLITYTAYTGSLRFIGNISRWNVNSQKFSRMLSCHSRLHCSIVTERSFRHTAPVYKTTRHVGGI